MAGTDETDSPESAPSAVTPDDSADSDLTADLPGEMLAEDLVDPDEYEVAADETEAEELDAVSARDLDPAEVDERIAPLDFEVDDEEQLAEAEAAAAVAASSRPERRKRPVRRAPVDDEAEDEVTPTSAASPDEAEGGLGSRRPQRRTAAAEASDTGKKKVSANKKKKGKARARRTGPVQFTRESVGELKKVVWPTLPQLRQYFIVVLLFVVLIIAYVGLLDLGFGAGLLWLFGRQA
ncbi:preprotein translocase subunit SecE [Propionicicella superfundia]|uniref:preprotein translocase subunit SecE n=1 Tax=Propionicicella superfundia TaxID=348582 RepID=UPI00041FA41F|nr:preprotein translocase subunit SecE [Propionicicella superfundia]